MSCLGLTSREAQERLSAELTRLLNSRVKIGWLREARNNPLPVLRAALTGAAGLILVVQVAVFPERRTAVSLFQAIFLLFLATFNLSLLGWEVYMLQTLKVRKLLCKLAPTLDNPCPWTWSDYPKSSISTLRGPLTIPAFRDGVLVNTPISLLVYGDVIELDPGIPSPAKAVLRENGSAEVIMQVEVSEVLPEHVFKKRDVKDKGGSFKFLAEMNPVLLEIVKTPILAFLESALQKDDPLSFLSREINLLIYITTVALAPIYFSALVLNVLRYFLLKEDFDDSWPEMFFGLPVYTAIPLLLPYFPLVWFLSNLYGTARVILLVEGGPLYFCKSDWKGKGMVYIRTLRIMWELVCWCTHHPNYKVFHILGTLTSVCAVDKEYLLSSGFPSPEKIFLLKTEGVVTEEVEPQAGTKRQTSMGAHNNDDIVGNARHNREVRIEPTDVRLAVTVPDSGDVNLPKTSMDQQQQHLHTSPTMSVKFSLGLETDEVKKECEQDKSDTLQILSYADSLTASPILSDYTPFELVMEILDVSPDPNSFSGIAFDDVNWQANIGSLKAIGVNLLSTSHITKTPFYFPPLDSYGELQQHLHKSSCSCSLGSEIGVTEYYSRKLKKQVMLYSVSSPGVDFRKTFLRKSMAPSVVNYNCNIPPHITSTMISELETGKNLIMSRGSGDMIASCCSDFWDGGDVQPMTDAERLSIVEYYNARSISSYCVALAYNPMMDLNASDLPQKNIGIFIPPSSLEKNPSDLSLTVSCKEPYSQLSTAEQIFKNLQCNQVFLGLVTLQYRPKLGVVSLIEDLYAAGIRFVHFTAEHEHRAKIFAQKLGLEADWNSFISLARPTPEKVVVDAKEQPSEAVISDDEDDNESSMASSMRSLVYGALSNILARLPKGIDNIRPHIEKVDNVPLLVSLFTDCTTQTITSMIEIMQENSEVIMCMGNAWNHENASIFSQADIGLSLIPRYVDFPMCTVTETCAVSNSHSLQNNGSVTAQSKSSFSPLELASYLNSMSCHLCFGRDDNVSLPSIIWESRRLLSLVRLSLIFSMGASFSLSALMLFSSLFFLPPPLSSSHLFWAITAVIPLITLSFLATPLDPKFKTLMPIKKKKPFPEFWLVILEFGLFGITGLYALFLFSLTLGQLCNTKTTSHCHVLLGDRNRNNSSPWNGWRGQNEKELFFAQDFVAFFMTIYLIVLSIRYIHLTRPLWELWKFISWHYVAATSGAIVLQVVYLVVSQSVGERLPVTSGLSSVPVHVWCLCFLWPFVIIPMAEILKHVDKKKFKKTQTLLELQFGTRLGMHSPVS